ncbi:hypothetical protein EV368DRAFT_65983 [Lentinula lateritia]|nr:hypothetical protein EV368DRAFT_65983 [Lentinula lateritia]
MTANPAPVSTAPVLPALPPAKETPYKSRTTDLPIFREGQLDDKRDAVIEDLGNMVPEVDLDWFFENLLPPMPKGVDTATVVEQLRKSGVITENGWAGFSLNPQDERRHEDVVFAQLQPIFEAISDTVQELYPSLQQTFTLLLQPTKYPTSERACTSKPDNCWVAIEDAERIKNDPGRYYTWYNIAGPAEDKKLPESSREQRNKNVAQIVFNMQQIMSLDPCRRFTFGTTMQDRELRVWYACRGFVLTTKACDFLKDYHRLVHLYIAFAFSSRVDFGWDPTISCISPEFIWQDERKRRVYKIQVRDDEGHVQSFKTVRILADYAADSTISRATRVWLVEDEQGTQYVLKDVWLDMDRLPEHIIRAQMLTDVLEKCGADDHVTLQNHLLTPCICGKVFVNGVVDTTDDMIHNQPPRLSSNSVFTLKLEQTKNPLRQSCDPASSSATLSTAVKGHSHNRNSQGKLTTTWQAPQTPILRRKYHYRIVFFEYGHTLFAEKSLLNIYTTLTDLLTALHIIHRSGWVHRDISCGNVYYYAGPHEAEPRGLLGDLEYARNCDSREEHQMRTGTLDFMASEVVSQVWNYMVPPPRPPPKKGVVYNLPERAPFTYTPLHDLESCLWLLVYILFFNDDALNPLLDPQSLILRNKKTNQLFSRKAETFWRFYFIRDWDTINIHTTGLSPTLESAVRTVSYFASYLHAAFQEIQKPYTSVTVEESFLQTLYDNILTLVNEDSPLREEIRGIQLKPIPKPVMSVGEKRKAEEEADKDNVSNLPKSKKSRTHTSLHGLCGTLF